VAVVLLVVAVAIPVLAQDTPTPTPPVAITTQVDVLDKVAAKLGIERSTLVGAIAQAKDELRNQRPFTADDFYNKVAGKLAVSKDTLVNAITEATKEVREDALKNQLSRAVQNGLMSESEAKEIETWLAQRPSVIDRLLGNGLLRGNDHH
jgi:predicted outer membrane protein